MIKGGGRADLSPDVEAAIVDYLRSNRDAKNPLLPKRKRTTFSSSTACPKHHEQHEEEEDDQEPAEEEESPHEAAKYRKRFLKRLVQQYEQSTLSAKLNNSLQKPNSSSTPPTNTNNNSSSRSNISSSSNGKTVAASALPANTSGAAVCGKVRVDIVEAIYYNSNIKKNNKRNDSNNTSSSSSSSSSAALLSWKPGSIKKTLVLERSTTVEELQKMAQAKLQLKKKPNRVFCVEKTKSSSSACFEIPLVTNLAGLADGATIHVATATATTTNTVPPVPKKSGRHRSADDVGEEEVDSMTSSQAAVAGILAMDPLEATKEAYFALQEKGKSSFSSSPLIDNQNNKNDIANMTNMAKERIFFSPHLEQLPPITAERLQLPAASFRRDILKAMDMSRVVIICGEAGCGKSTQIPQYIYEGMLAAGHGDEANIVVTQPRRVAAMALADRVAQEHQATMLLCSDSPVAVTTSIRSNRSRNRNRNNSSSGEGTVAYQVRLDSTVTKKTKITYCTVGILLRRLTSFRSNDDSVPLANVTHLIIDEVHERNCDADFSLAILRAALAVNPRLSLILMSATNTPDLFVEYFAHLPQPTKIVKTVDWNAPVVLEIPGRTFPVDTFWLPEIEKGIHKTMKGAIYGGDSALASTSTKLRVQQTTAAGGAALSPKATTAIDYDFVSSLIQGIASGMYSVGDKRSGAVLVFLPGKAEIEAQKRSLERTLEESSFNICVLHSTVSKQGQQSVFCPPPLERAKIVLATNIAETSITIPNVGYVIDTGLMKEVRYNAASNMEELVTVWTSLAAGMQRQGRAGRTGHGICFKLYTEEFSKTNFLDRTTPEVLRTPLEELVLHVCLLDETRRHRQSKDETSPSHHARRPPGTRIIRFLGQLPDPPRNDSVKDACMHLVDVGALTILSNGDDDGGSDLCVKVTPLGFHLAHFPLNAKLGKVLILGSILGCVDPALTVAASLTATKPVWLNCPGAATAHREVVRLGFGGETWSGGTSKGDLIASVAAFNAWNGQADGRRKRDFCLRNFLNHEILSEIAELREQFRKCLEDAGFVRRDSMDDGNEHSDNALLTSCCILAGLYPNIATLVRPVKGKLGFRGGRLMTRNGDSCVPSSSSFQAERVRSVAETGRDAYAVFHSKLKLSVADCLRPDRIILDGVNFVSRFALIFFGGELQVHDNFLVVGEWLKFKVSGSSCAGSNEDDARKKVRPVVAAILLHELRKELDALLLLRLHHCLSKNDARETDRRSDDLIELVLRILEQE